MAPSIIRKSEERLVEQLFAGKPKVENGITLAIKVLAREDNRRILDEHLPYTALRSVVSNVFLSNPDDSVQIMLPRLARELLKRHRHVSDRKGKKLWLDSDGTDVWAVDARPMALGFHSYRFPQLMSLRHDLQLRESDLNHA